MLQEESELPFRIYPFFFFFEKGISLLLSLKGPGKYQNTFSKDWLEIRIYLFFFLIIIIHTRFFQLTKIFDINTVIYFLKLVRFTVKVVPTTPVHQKHAVNIGTIIPSVWYAATILQFNFEVFFTAGKWDIVVRTAQNIQWIWSLDQIHTFTHRRGLLRQFFVVVSSATVFWNERTIWV